ncbi:MAG: GNAT family N-acetyltransferase [bacterium]|nr:GNAT family N-acetyltransferase [bacterium]
MEEIRYYNIEGAKVPLVISDEETALSRAKAQGRAVLGIMRGDVFLPVPYVAESLEDVDEVFAKRVILRQMGMPWVIAVTERLIIREFRSEDWDEMEFLDHDVFLERDRFEAYIQTQYPFFEYGLWAVVERASSKLVGRVGVWDGKEDEIHSSEQDIGERDINEQNISEQEVNTPLELGYHIFSAYRCRGYAREACCAVLRWCKQEESTAGRRIYTKIEASNQASICLARELGVIRILGKKESLFS